MLQWGDRWNLNPFPQLHRLLCYRLHHGHNGWEGTRTPKAHRSLVFKTSAVTNLLAHPKKYYNGDFIPIYYHGHNSLIRNRCGGIHRFIFKNLGKNKTESEGIEPPLPAKVGSGLANQRITKLCQLSCKCRYKKRHMISFYNVVDESINV